MEKTDIGVYGLGVMGSNLALNLEQNRLTVSLFNRTVPGVEEDVVDSFLESKGTNKNFVGSHSIEKFIASLKKPRKILLTVKAGKAVDQVIQQLSPLLEAGDILIDCGNSHFKDTMRRGEELDTQNISYLGMGVSGGAEGARHGPSLMPGGSPEAWNEVRPILERIAAKDDNDKPCCTWVGREGAGHFVKMVHNGIEYGDMQLIAECYHLMNTGLDMPAVKIAAVFDEWNQGHLNCFLLEITSDILRVEDDDGVPLVEKILDAAGQKGTGRWTSITALEWGAPLPVITSAVFGRMLSSLKSIRKDLSTQLRGPVSALDQDKGAVLNRLEQALLAGRLITLAEGFFLIRQISLAYGWNINLTEIARIWQNGCIIRSELLKTVQGAFFEDSDIEHLLSAPSFAQLLKTNQQAFRETISLCIKQGIPCPAMGNALAYYDSIRSGWLPANIIQAQRDYFGAHGYERTDRGRGDFYHSDWKPKT